MFTKESAFNSPDSDQAAGNKEDISNIFFDPELVCREINKLRDNSAQGPDDIGPWVLKQASHLVSYPLAVIFGRSMQQGKVPHDFQDALVCPIFK